MSEDITVNIDKHMAIIGQTGEGKTPIANELYNNTFTDSDADAKVIYFDFEDVGEIDSVQEFDRTDDLDDMKDALNNGKRVSFIPSGRDEETRREEANYLFKKLEEWNMVCLVFADEIQEYGGDQNNPFNRYAVRGQKYGVHLVSITQRPAKLPLTIGTQTNVWLFFDVSDMEAEYFKKHGLPFDRIKEALKDTPKHSFVIYVKGQGVSRPMMLRL